MHIGCRIVMRAPSGSFQSPNYPSNYPDNANCEYSIEVASGSRVKLHIDDMSLEHHSTCGFDAFHIYDGTSVSSKKLAVLCGINHNAKEFVSSGRYMLIKFKSDGSVSAKGYRVSYKTGIYFINSIYMLCFAILSSLKLCHAIICYKIISFLSFVIVVSAKLFFSYRRPEFSILWSAD